MANWLLDYIEMTEYIPPEFRDQSFSMRELDLKVSIAMSQLEKDIKDFFSKIDSFSPQEKQERYDALLRKCEEASQVANKKIKIADRLHDLVEKSMRLLDQGLEKLKEDLIEGDKAYIVEDIERRSQEMDQQLRQEEELKMQRHQRIRDSRLNHSKSLTQFNQSSNHLNNHRQSTPAIHSQIQHNSHYINNNHSHPANRNRNNSTGTQPTIAGRQKKKERKRINSAMTIFNRNSKPDEDTAQTFLPSPTTPDYLAGLHSSNSNSMNDISGGDTSCLNLKGMIAVNKHPSGSNERSNGYESLAKARQPILTAIDAAHAVSPSATNGDRLVLYSNNSNGDNFESTTHNNKDRQSNPTSLSHKNKNNHIDSSQSSQLSNHLIPPMSLNNSGHNLFNNYVNSDINNSAISDKFNDTHYTNRAGGPFSSLTLSARHDPIMMAASQAIHATQNMTPGRRTSSLKASYAAVNSGRLPHHQTSHPVFDQTNMTGEIYCKCRGTVHDPNMIACDNANCKYEWFHYECVGITTPPPGEWYCEDCKGLSKVQDRPNTNRQPKTGAVTTN